MQRLAIGGGVIIGIAAFNRHRNAPHEAEAGRGAVAPPRRLLRFGSGVLRRRPLIGLPPALERFFIAFPVGCEGHRIRSKAPPEVAYSCSSNKPLRQQLGDTTIGIALCSGEGTMGQWLIADLSVSDVHVQLWMLLVTGILLLWFLYVWVTR